MNSVLHKMRQLYGVIMDVALIVIFVAYLGGDFKLDSERHHGYQTLSYGNAKSGEIVLRHPSTNFPNHYFDVVRPSTPEFSPFLFDMASLKVVLAKAFYINTFERSVFYVFTSIKAP